MAIRQSIKLTKRVVDAIKANGSDIVYWDRGLTGFGLRVRKSGRKNYVMQTRVDGKLRWFTIGQHGPYTPEEARNEALEILSNARKGVDRRTNSRAKPKPTMSDLGKRFLEEYVPNHCKGNTPREYGCLVKRHIDPNLGHLPVSEIQRKEIAELHHDLRKSPYQANRLLAVISKMLSVAEVWNWRPGWVEPLPEHQALQGTETRKIPVRGGIRRTGESPA